MGSNNAYANRMKKFIYSFGTLALALAMSGLPAAAFAEHGDEGQDEVSVHIGAQTQGLNVQAGSVVRVDEEEHSSGGQQKKEDMQREEQIDATSSHDQIDEEEMSDQSLGEDQDEIHFDLEDDEDVATSFHDLQQKIEVRKHQLDQELASTSPDHQQIVENANEVRVAVHSLLASKELLGGIGPKVSEIAKDMNNSVATTTNAEAQIQSRSFLARLFFGGDSAAADVIAQQVAQNQQRIDDLNKMLGEANVSTDIQVTLRAQIAAIQEAQVRLQELAQKEQSQWGLFSWRF